MVKSGDHALVERCRNGDRRAFEALIGEYQRPVYNAAYRILGNPDDAADATQATFLKAFEKLDRYDSNYKFFSWVYRIAINESINQRKHLRRQRSLDENQPAAGAGPDSTVETDGLAHEIQGSLMALSDDYRTVVVLRHFSDLSYRQIGEILDIPEKTVKSRLYSARQLMKARLAANGIEL